MAGWKTNMFNNPINSVFDKLVEQLPQPDWLMKKRKEALKTFQAFGLPTRKSELWKYTDTSRLQRLEALSGDCSSDERIKISIKQGEASVTSLKKSEEADWQDLPIDKERAFIALNTAMLNSDRLITIEKNQQVKMHIHYAQTDENWSNIRTQINVKENAQLDLTESYDTDCRINHVAIINAEKNVKLILKSNKIQSQTAALIHYTQINCKQAVTIEQLKINNNSALLHMIQDVNFEGEQGCFRGASVNVVEGFCHIAENIQVNHLVKNCKSEFVCRSLAKAKGQIALNAKAVVSVAADGSDVSQSLKNILFSDDAKIYSRPELEINTDDVIAAHGSTTGELDELALTYLRSRGIPKAQAQTMLIESFLQDANIFNQENFLDTIKL